MHEFLTTAEASDLIRVAPATLRQWRSRRTPGTPPWTKTASGTARYRRADLLAWMGVESATTD